MPEDWHPSLKSPVLFLAVAFALGAGLAGSAPASPVHLFRSIPLLVTAGALCLGSGALLIRAARERWAVVAVLAGFILAGAAAALLFSFRFPPNHLSHLESWGIDIREPMEVEGTVETGCVITPAGCEFDLEAGTLRLRGDMGLTRHVSGKVRVQIALTRASAGSAESALGMRAGDRVQASMLLRRPHVALNPGSFDFRERAANIEDLYWEATVQDPSTLRRLPAGRASPRLLESIRARLRRVIDRMYPPWSAEGRDGAVLKAILLGDRTALDSATVDHFRASGLYHLLVIAGLHVGLIAALIVGLLRLLGLHRLWRNYILLMVLLANALIVEQRAPTLRATLMLVIFLLAQFLGRDHSAMNAVGLAALILLLSRPAWIFESGFQLSFAAALLIVALAAPLLRMSVEPYRNALRHLEDEERDTALPPKLAQFRLDLRLVVSILRRSAFLNRHPAGVQRTVVWPLAATFWIGGMVLFSAVLQVGLLLPMVEQFHRVTLAGVGLNALALPLMAVLLGVAIPTVLLALVAPSVAVWPAKVLTLVFQALFAIAEWPHLPDWLSYRVPSPPLWVAAGFAVSLIGLAVSLSRRRTAIAFFAAFVVFALALTTAPFAPRIDRDTLEITALDCGGGEAAFLVLPDRTTMLMGACGAGRARPEFAPAKRWDPGENIVSPYLWSRGIKALDVVVLTSAAGNLDGFVAIAQNFRVGEIWFRDSDAGVASILEEAGRRHVKMRAVSPGEVLRLRDTIIDFVVPPDASRPSVSPLIARVLNGEKRVLIAGGSSVQELRRVLESNGKVGVVVTTTARHTLVWATQPTLPLAELPVPEGDPLTASFENEKLLEDERLPLLLTERSEQPLVTDHDGAVTVKMRNGTVDVTSFRESTMRGVTR